MKNIPILLIVAILFAACRGAENKADTKDKEKEVDTTSVVAPSTMETEKPEVSTSRTPELPPPPAPAKKTSRPRNPDIISRIDDHLVSTSNFTAGPTGGITNGSVTVKNTFADITIQKALLEVSVRKADGSEVRTDYYSVINLEPGGTKQVNLPNTSQGSKLILHIVKVKSDQLTNGEFVLAGSHAQK